MRGCWLLGSRSCASGSANALDTTTAAVESSIAALIPPVSRQLQPRARIQAAIGATMNTLIPTWTSIDVGSAERTPLIELFAPAVGSQARRLVHIAHGDGQQQQQARARMH